MADFDPSDRAREAYELAYGRVVEARAAWNAAGRPLVAILHNGVETTDPLLKTLRDLEHDASKRLAEARVKHRGPAPKAVVQTQIGESPAQKLRLAK